MGRSKARVSGLFLCIFAVELGAFNNAGSVMWFSTRLGSLQIMKCFSIDWCSTGYIIGRAGISTALGIRHFMAHVFQRTSVLAYDGKIDSSIAPVEVFNYSS